ncbi:hypothetical protein GCM10011360_41530 [Primorskyibacter flagellatus]|uniref:Extracellular solute-binding protein n=1 Tax=Primorskyibacter flagellatus TaxID=1387277 RepID=A0A917AH51_9RHOB|nr:extracellular solute-binding protein [Primorskyibacter flagellatus]GGE50194.1 hypothetical protein GCM10011360_41530 [Primorskyibacter flagellatus]
MDRRHFLNTAAAAGLVTAVPKLTLAQEQALVEAAIKEGEVNWYTTLVVNPAVRPMVAAFEAKYPGIKVNTITGKVGDLLIRVSGELDADKLEADVYHGSTTLQAMRKRDEVARFLPDSAPTYPEAMVDPDGYWIAQEINYTGPACNTDMVSEADAPKTYEDLLNPKWKGNIAWAAAMQQSGPPGFICAVLGIMGEDKGMEFLKRLSDQDIVNVPTNQKGVLDKIAAGEYPLGLQIFSHHVLMIQEAGAPVRFLSISPAVLNTIDPLYLMKKAPNPNAGKLLINFISSPEGQRVLLAGQYNPAHPDERDPDKDYKAFTLTPNMVAEHLERWIGIYDQYFA